MFLGLPFDDGTAQGLIQDICGETAFKTTVTLFQYRV
jgi:hypothetical protein